MDDVRFDRSSVAARVHAAVVKRAEQALLAAIEPSVLYEVEAALQAERTSQSAQDAAADTAVAHAALAERVTLLVLKDGRVREAIDNVSQIVAEVARDEVEKLPPDEEST